jgi:hypothetical protein
VSNENLASVLTDRSPHLHHSLPEGGVTNERLSELAIRAGHDALPRTVEVTNDVAPFVQTIVEVVVRRTLLGRTCCSTAQLSWSRCISRVREGGRTRSRRFVDCLKESSGDSSSSLV